MLAGRFSSPFVQNWRFFTDLFALLRFHTSTQNLRSFLSREDFIRELNLQSLEFKDNHKHDAYRCNLSLSFEARDKMVLTMMLMQKGTKLV